MVSGARVLYRIGTFDTPNPSQTSDEDLDVFSKMARAEVHQCLLACNISLELSFAVSEHHLANQPSGGYVIVFSSSLVEAKLYFTLFVLLRLFLNVTRMSLL